MIILTGDINLTEGAFDVGVGIGSKLKEGFNPFERIERNSNDIWIGNFEGVASLISENKGIEAKRFIIRPELLKHFKHCDFYSVANNHSMEHGGSAFLETSKAICYFGSKYFGYGDNKSQIFKHQGKTVSVTGFSTRPDGFRRNPLYWFLPENKELQEELQNVEKQGAEFKIAYIHGGIEFISYPYNDQKSFYRSMIDMGYDIVIGMHPHILQGYEIYNGKYIFYSLGNFVFNMAWEKTKYGAIVKVDLSGDEVKVSSEYIKIEDDFTPRIIENTSVPVDCRFEYLNKLLSITEENEKYFVKANSALTEYRKANRKWILKNMIHMPKKFVFGIFTEFIKRRIKY